MNRRGTEPYARWCVRPPASVKVQRAMHGDLPVQVVLADDLEVEVLYEPSKGNH